MAYPVIDVEDEGKVTYQFPRRIEAILANATKDIDLSRYTKIRGMPPVSSLEVQNTGTGSVNILLRIWGDDTIPIPAGLIMSVSLAQVDNKVRGIDGYSISYDGADVAIPENSITVIERS
jgi:hypothetical protein